MKYLIRDYIYGWRLENFKEIYKNGTLAGMMFLYAFVINVTATGNIIMLGYYVPVAIVYLSIFIHPVSLRKMYYVCPLTPDEREKLVRDSYIFRIVMHMLILTFGNIFIMTVTKFSMPVFIYVTINALITSTILPYGNKDGLSAYVIALLVICVVTNSWQFDILQRASYNPIIEQRLLYAIMVFVEFTICIGYAKQVKRKIKSAAVYEEVVL